MNARTVVAFRATLAGSCLLAAFGAHAASFTLSIAPNPPKTYTYPQCSSFTWSGSTLTCVASGPPPPPLPAPTASAHAVVDAVHGVPVECNDDRRAMGIEPDQHVRLWLLRRHILSIKLEVPLGASGTKIRTTSWTEYGSGPVVQEGGVLDPCLRFRDPVRGEDGAWRRPAGWKTYPVLVHVYRRCAVDLRREPDAGADLLPERSQPVSRRLAVVQLSPATLRETSRRSRRAGSRGPCARGGPW